CPAERSRDAPETSPNFLIRETLRVVGAVHPYDGHARIEYDLIKHLCHCFRLSADTTSLITGRHLLDFVRGMLSTNTTDTSMPGTLADTVESIAPRLSSAKPLRGTMRNSTE